MTGQTASIVQDEGTERAQRRQAITLDESLLGGLTMYAQLLVGLALYAYDHIGTPGSLSLLLTLPYLLVTLLWARRLAKRAPGAGLLSLASGWMKRSLASFLLPAALMDAVLLFYGLCAMIADAMTDVPPAFAALAVAAFAALSLFRQGDQALGRLARLLLPVILGLLLYCAAAALPHGKAAHFFPLLGPGPARILEGALWLCGAVSGCVWPLVTNKTSGAPDALLRPNPPLRPALLSLAAGILTMLLAVWLMPAYALARPYTTGWRMLLVTHMTPSTAAWSMEFIGLTLLLLLGLCECLSRAGRMLLIIGNRRSAPLLPLALSLFLLPFGAGKNAAFEQTLISLAPWRAVIPPLALAVLSLVSRNKKKAGSGREAAK